MVWSFLEKFPNVQSAKFIKDEIHLRERKKDLQEHWPKCLSATNGDVEKAKDMFVDIVFNRPVWLEVVRLADPPRKAHLMRVHVDYLLSRTSVSPYLPAASAAGLTADLNIESVFPAQTLRLMVRLLATRRPPWQ